MTLRLSPAVDADHDNPICLTFTGLWKNGNLGGNNRRIVKNPPKSCFGEEFDLITRLLGIVALAATFSAGASFAASDHGNSDGDSDVEYSDAQVALFGTPHLDNIKNPLTLRYAYRHGGAADAAFDDEIKVTVTTISADGGKDMDFEYMTGERRKPFNGVSSFRGNPLIMLFLQDDINRMSKLVGGGEAYLRNRVRSAFLVQAETAPVRFEFEGQQVGGTRVTVTPFVGDEHRAELKEFEFKRYEFTLSPEVPGAVYSIRSIVPQADGDAPLYEDMVTYRDVAS